MISVQSTMRALPMFSKTSNIYTMDFPVNRVIRKTAFYIICNIKPCNITSS